MSQLFKRGNTWVNTETARKMAQGIKDEETATEDEILAKADALEGEEIVLTQEDLDMNPELVEDGQEVGDVLVVGKVITDEEEIKEAKKAAKEAAKLAKEAKKTK